MHEQYLLAGLQQARLGQGQCAPNPCVGAVAVQNGKIIAQDWHRGAGNLHAEPLVLAKIPPGTPGITLYITLEPCNHWGKTPPCVDAIIKHGIDHVVFAFKDPNPIVAQNNSTELLKSHGVEVTQISVPEIDAFYESYLHWTHTKRPKVTAKMALSLDGKIAKSGGQAMALSNDVCARFTHQQRKATDIILTSAHTLARDNPRMTARVAGMEHQKRVAVIDGQVHLNPELHVIQSGTSSLYHARGDYNIAGCTSYLMPEHEGHVSLDAVIAHLGGLGYHDVWVEAGGRLFTALHEQGLVDTTYLYLTPHVLGEDAVPAFTSTHVFDRPHRITWHPMGDNAMARVDWQEHECLQE